ncbi:PLEKHG5 (predicted) [Pycnogonum litorale]
MAAVADEGIQFKMPRAIVTNIRPSNKIYGYTSISKLQSCRRSDTIYRSWDENLHNNRKHFKSPNYKERHNVISNFLLNNNNEVSRLNRHLSEGDIFSGRLAVESEECWSKRQLCRNNVVYRSKIKKVVRSAIEVEQEVSTLDVHKGDSQVMSNEKSQIHRTYSASSSTSNDSNSKLTLDNKNRSKGFQESNVKPNSKVFNNSDHFTVQFDSLDKPRETFPAVRGTTLRDVLTSYLKKEGLSLSQLLFYIDHSDTPVPLEFESFRLAGSILHVKEKDDNEKVCSNDNGHGVFNTISLKTAKEERKGSIRKPNQNIKYKKSFMSSEELHSQEYSNVSAQDGSWKPTKIKTQGRITSFFTNAFKNDKDKLEVLIEQLNQYSLTGIPNSHRTAKGASQTRSYSDEQDESNRSIDSLYHLEDNWTDIVDDEMELPEKITNQQNALWELVKTEVGYIHLVKVITDLFLSCLISLQKADILIEIETDRLFNNIDEVRRANEDFWKIYIHPMLVVAREHKKPLNPQLLENGFVQFESLFSPYKQYCTTQKSSLDYLKTKNMENNDLFKAYLAWCESHHKQFNRLRLKDLLAKPTQRLTKYSLLLKRVQKKTIEEYQIEALQRMNHSVESFVLSVDCAIRQQEEQERLASIISRIDSYDALDSNNDDIDRRIKEHCALDLTCPMPGCGVNGRRNLLLEGSNLKLREASSSSKIDVHCILFTDMLLVCKFVSKTKKVKVIRQPYVVDRLVVHELKDGNGLLMMYLNEYKLVTSAFVLQCHQDTKLWHESIQKAQYLYKEAKNPEIHSVWYLRCDDEECYEYSSMAYLAASSRSPTYSSRPSLMHSNSGSTDMSDSVPCPPNVTPNNHARGVSLEFMEPKTFNMSSDEASPDQLARSRDWKCGCRHPISPKLERRAFLIKSSSSTGPGSPVSSNMLTVAHPYYFADTREVKSFDDSVPPPSLTVPSNKCHLFPDSHNSNHTHNQIMIRSMPVLPVGINKPPLVKTKNISHANSTSSLGDSFCATQLKTDCISRDCQDGNETVGDIQRLTTQTFAASDKGDWNSEIDEDCKGKLRRNGRQEKRYYTADAIEAIKQDINKESSTIQKRLSWNYKGQGFHQPHQHMQNYKFLMTTSSQPGCSSNDSLYSSSGVSSTGSSDTASSSQECDSFQVSKSATLQKSAHVSDDTALMESSSCDHKVAMNKDRGTIKVDVGEIKLGISSVKITLPEAANTNQRDDDGTNRSDAKPTKADLIRMKHFLLTDTTSESTEV